MSSLGSGHDPVIDRPPPVALAVALADVPPRCETAFSEAQTLVRSNSNRSRSSIAKPPIISEPPGASSSSGAEQPALRSIFPTYNPNLPLDRQEYFPTQASPTHIPRSAISRPLYSPEPRTPGLALRSPMLSTATQMSAGSTARWPPRTAEPPVIPPTSTTEELTGLWKVANGWKASASEGRVYCLKMTSERDAPVYALSSSADQPFYDLRLDPTSTSAYVTLSRHDPHKPFKGASATGSSASVGNGSKTEGKHWQEVLTTTLEEEARRHPPHDGLVALLYPSAAARMALERPDSAATVMLAENECARLVWDADSGNHFLAHPALAMPFCVTVERNAVWSRTEYTLEHIESPRHLARLTRDGTGNGWLEIDTAIAAKIDSVYLADVAVTALMLVAHKDDRFARAEVFEPPPMPGSPAAGSIASGHAGSGRGSRLGLPGWRDSGSGREERAAGKKMTKKQKKKKTTGGGGGKRRMEEFEMDIESQDSEMGKLDRKEKEEKLPGVVRALIKLLTAVFKCAIWVVSIGFRALAAIVGGLAKCVTSKA